MSDAVESWLLGLVGYYRPFGFFGAYRELEDKDLVEVLIALGHTAAAHPGGRLGVVARRPHG